MFGEKDILQCKLSTETYTAMCDCYLLSVTRSQFQVLLEEFEDFKFEVFATSMRNWCWREKTVIEPK